VLYKTLPGPPVTPTARAEGGQPAGREASMRKQGIRELVGRAMVDPDFLDSLVRAPESTLVEYELDDTERAAVLQAVTRLRSTPSTQRAGAFRSTLVRRLAT